MRSFLAGLLLFVSLLTGTAALTAYVVHEVPLDPAQAGRVVDAALQDSSVRDEVLAKVVPQYDNLPSVLKSGVTTVATTPTVRRAVRSITLDSDGRADLTPLRTALARGLSANGQDNLAATLTSAGGDRVTVDLPARYLKKYQDARDRTWFVATRGAIVTAVLLVLALLVSGRRRRTLGGAGVVVLLCSAASLGLFWLLPSAIRTATSDPRIEVMAAVAQSERSGVLTTLLPFAVIGVVLLAVSLVLPKGRSTQ